MPLLKGIIPVIPTPFSENGEKADIEVFQRLVEHGIDEGANALCLFAAGAEFYKLTKEERKELLNAAVAVNQGRVPILVTVSEHATLLAEREASYYQEHGADAINIMPPSFAAPSGPMITRHLARVCKSVSIPAMIQYAPALTGMTIALEAFREIMESGSIPELYVKLEASPTGPLITSFQNATKGKYHIVVGNGGECMYEALERGACAVMPGLSMVRKFREIYDMYSAGNAETAYKMFQRFLPFVHFMLRDIEQFVAMEKIILRDKGLLPNTLCREPNNYPDPYTINILNRLVRELNESETNTPPFREGTGSFRQ